jgi:hypothetical protein
MFLKEFFVLQDTVLLFWSKSYKIKKMHHDVRGYQQDLGLTLQRHKKYVIMEDRSRCFLKIKSNFYFGTLFVFDLKEFLF